MVISLWNASAPILGYTFLVEHTAHLSHFGYNALWMSRNHAMLCGTMENLIMELGSSESFWNLDPKIWGILATPGWIKSTWEDISTTPLHLKGPLPTIPLLHQHDQLLMDLFVTHGFTGDLLCTLNHIQIHLHVFRISDMVSADGTSITKSVWECNTI
jgi:hypothetical protein